MFAGLGLSCALHGPLLVLMTRGTVTAARPVADALAIVPESQPTTRELASQAIRPPAVSPSAAGRRRGTAHKIEIQEVGRAETARPLASPSSAPRAVAPPIADPSRETVQALRLQDDFPRLPDGVRDAGTAYTCFVQICVSREGTVDGVTVRGAPPLLEQALRGAISTWRYRPWVQGGVARPFCHPMRIDYSAD